MCWRRKRSQGFKGGVGRIRGNNVSEGVYVGREGRGERESQRVRILYDCDQFVSR